MVLFSSYEGDLSIISLITNQGVKTRTIYLKTTYTAYFLSLGLVFKDLNCIHMIKIQ